MTRHTLSALALGTALGVGLATAGAAIAGGGGGGHHRGHHGPPPIERLAEALDLTDEQVEALQAFRDERHEQREAMHAQLREKHEAMRTRMMSDDPDAKAIHALIDEIGALKLEAAHDRADGMLEMHATLTPEQREAFRELRERRGHHGPPPHDPFGPPPGE